jgi:hypothetical protein
MDGRQFKERLEYERGLPKPFSPAEAPQACRHDLSLCALAPVVLVAQEPHGAARSAFQDRVGTRGHNAG